MLTIVIPNRNRKLATVRRTLASLDTQCVDGVKAVVVDYGSDPSYQTALSKLVKEFQGIDVHTFPTQGQLWQKTRAINIALKQCDTPYFMVADMDMLFHPEFVIKALILAAIEQAIYFQVGILTEEESKKEIRFDDYEIKFKTNEGATGMTLFPTEMLCSINGFDEFYHGWGAEDTDVHVRLQNAEKNVVFYNKECLLLHQWHPKFYRSKESLEPYHSSLEKINHGYLKLSRKLKKIKANSNKGWGVAPNTDGYNLLSKPTTHINFAAESSTVKGLCAQLDEGILNGVVHIEVQQNVSKKTLKEVVRKQLGKAVKEAISLDIVNDLLLEAIIRNCRNIPYQYAYDRELKQIVCTLNFDASI